MIASSRTQNLLLLISLLAIAGCTTRQAPAPSSAQRGEHQVAPGVVYRFYPASDSLSPNSAVHVLDVDLSAPGIGLKIAARNPGFQNGSIYGDAFTIGGWLDQEDHAIAGVNGGFFGLTAGDRKEIVGLLVRNGVIESSGSKYRSPMSKDRRFVRSAFTLEKNGAPRLGWMTGRRLKDSILKNHDRPLNPTRASRIRVQEAVACGPRLVQAGRINITDLDEKLGSADAVPRTFLAFDRGNGKARRLILCTAPAMRYPDCAAFAMRYFEEIVSVPCAEAMCMDGGSSTQLAFRKENSIELASPSFVSVPTAVIVTRER